MRIRSLSCLALVAFLLIGIAPVSAKADSGPVKVFILAGQSNMVGHGKTFNGLNPDYDPQQKQSATNRAEVPGGIGSLAWAVETMPDTYGPNGTDPLVDAKGDWLVRDDVSVYARMEVFKDKKNPGQLTKGITRKGPHTVGFGKADSNTQKWNGPEYGFGRVVGDALDGDVLIIKVATGGTSLYGDWRSPSAVQKRGGEVGYMWGHMLATVQGVLDNLGNEFPKYKGREHKIVGFGWHQGYNDTVHKTENENYGPNLVDFIADVRSVYGKDLPFVIGTTSMFPADKPTTPVERAQLAVAEADPHTVAVNTRPYWRDRSKSPSGFGYHWNHNGVSHYLIGAGMGRAYLTHVGKAKPGTARGPKAMPWEDPTYKTDIRATQAESRPGPNEPPNSWKLWLKHHNDRKQWCAAQEVDLLMVGDSIVFGWSRVGRPAWETFYGNRKAVNIGSSGDRTYHMLWHFQNGGLDGMKDRNPKVVVVMIGTNNRGEPDQKGADTAYGVLALLKEIHAKLPESKILLLAIFPRDDTPEGKGRVRNDQINKILKTYADNKTVHWLDLSGVYLNEDGTLKRDLMPDRLHPNLEGYKAWGKAMEPKLKELLGEK